MYLASRWDSIVKQSLEKSEGTRRVSSNALIVSMTGMTSLVHPAMRLPWKQRMQLLSVLTESVHNTNFMNKMVSIAVEFKECARRFTSNCISSAYATVSALLHVEHPVALLRPGGESLWIAGIEASATAFVRAGKAALEPRPNRDIMGCIRSAFQYQKSLVQPGPEGAFTPSPLAWNASFLGKGTASVSLNSNPCHAGAFEFVTLTLLVPTWQVHQKIPALSIAADVWAMAFRCNFLPFWAHSSTHLMRASRLDPIQHKSIHGMNAATRLTLLLEDTERMELQRLALGTVSSGVMSLEEIASEVLFIDGVRGSSCNGGSKSAIDSVRAIGDAGGKNAARILAFCRSAWISEELMIYDLGPTTARRQASALLKRLLINELYPDLDHSDPLRLLHLVPKHSSHLCVCLCCKRVSNAFASDGGAKHKSSFNEIGTSASMISVDPQTMEEHLRCAKRSSASLRTAVAFEEEAALRAVECEQCDESAVKSIIADSSKGCETGVSARARRDSKSAFEQRVSSVACGAEQMLATPIVGKAIRVFGEWYSLCAFCGCMVRFWPSNRAHGEICCMRCDYRMLHRKENIVNGKDAIVAQAQCRYCGKVDPMRTGARWRMCKSPHDATGKNASLPPPLRTVHFCPAHFKPWVVAALKALPMRVILSHIAFGAKPCFGADGEKRERPADTEKKPKRRRIVRKS